MKAKGIIIFKNNATHIIFFTIIKFISFSSSYIGPILTSLFYIPIRTFHFNNCEIMSIDLLHIQTLCSLSFPSKLGGKKNEGPIENQALHFLFPHTLLFSNQTNDISYLYVFFLLFFPFLHLLSN